MVSEIKDDNLTSHEIEVLEMFAGQREWEHGAWVNACCEFLRGFGYVTRAPYRITQKGRDYLKGLKKW
jgi:hypothetical protein